MVETSDDARACTPTTYRLAARIVMHLLSSGAALPHGERHPAELEEMTRRPAGHRFGA